MYVVDFGLTEPFVGSVRPVHIAGVVQVVPDQPAAHAHEKPVAPTAVQEPLFWQGFGEHPIIGTGSHVGALPLQALVVWQVRIALPFSM